MTTNVRRERKLDLVPTLPEVLAFVAAGYFLWFLAGGAPSDIFNSGGVKGIMAAVVGIGGGIILSRLLRAMRPGDRNLERAVPMLVLVGFVVAAPFLASGGYRATQLAAFAYMAIGTVGICVLTGWTGQGTIGNSVFAGLAAYTMAISINEWSVNPLLAAILGVLFAALLGLALGVPALRLRGLYLAIITMGVAIVFPPILKLHEVAKLTGGFHGLDLFRHRFGPPVDWGWLSDERWYYFLAMISLGVVLLLAYNLGTSAMGRAFRAVRDNEIAAAAMGVHVAQVRLLGFVISATFAGLAGVLLLVTGGRFLSPESFTIWMAFDFVIAQMLGGPTAILGSLLGAFYVIYVSREGLETVGTQTQDGSNVWLFLIGALIALFIIMRSRGLSKAIRELGPRLNPRFGLGLLNFLKIAAVAVVGLVFTVLLRLAADEGILDLTALRGAITGLVLIIIVLFVPIGFAGMAEGLKRLTWARVFEGLRQSVTAAAPVERPAELAVPRARQPASGILLSLLNGLLGRNRGGRGN